MTASYFKENKSKFIFKIIFSKIHIINQMHYFSYSHIILSKTRAMKLSIYLKTIKWNAHMILSHRAMLWKF